MYYVFALPLPEEKTLIKHCSDMSIELGGSMDILTLA